MKTKPNVKTKTAQNRNKKRKIRVERLAILGIAGLLIVGIGSWGLVSGVRKVTSMLTSGTNKPASGTEDVSKTGMNADGKNTDHPEGSTDPFADSRKACTPADGYDLCFTFSGVGDNLIHETLYEGEGPYKESRNFAPYYEKTLPYTSTSDLSYINFEVLCAGEDFGFSGYPDFNAPKEFIDALDASGFNWFSLASNHSLDRGPEGLIAQLKDIEENHSHIVYTGAHKTKEDHDKAIIKEINGIKVGMATFTYGLNGRDKPEGYEWVVDTYADNYGTIDYDLINKRMDDLNASSDIQIITMHWGIEYNPAADDTMVYLAQYLSERGADVIVGGHPHVIAPVEWMKNGSQDTLVYYSLGNFISGQQDMTNMIGGLAEFTVSCNSETRDILVHDASFTPTVTWFDDAESMYLTTTINEYDDELANSHGLLLLGKDTSPQFVTDYCSSVLGNPEGITLNLSAKPKESDIQEKNS